jgi:diguanylate cyclase (GGDEF)-like protein
MNGDFPIRNEEELREFFSCHDSRTYLLNRRGLLQQFAKLQHDNPDEEVRGALFLIELDSDGMKRLGSLYGFASWDQVPIEIAQRLKRMFLSPGIVACVNAHAFACIVSGSITIPDAKTLAIRALEAIAEPIELLVQGERIEVVQLACMGVALWEQSIDDLTQLIENVDRALIEAQDRGAGQCVTYADGGFT